MSNIEANLSGEPYDFERYNRTFYETARLMGHYYEMPWMVDQTEVLFSTREQPRHPDENQFPLMPIDSRYTKYEFNLPAHQFFYEGLRHYYGYIDGQLAAQAPSLSPRLYVGIGLGQIIARHKIQESCGMRIETTRYLERVEKFYADRKEVFDVFREVNPTATAEEKDIVTNLPNHIPDSGLFRINAIRAGVALFLAAMSTDDGGALQTMVHQESKQVLKYLVENNRETYIYVAKTANETSDRGNQTFTTWLPEWLVAFATPLDPARLDHA